jgi:hypothetical protein
MQLPQQGNAAPHCPFAVHVIKLLPEHSDEPGVHTPWQVPETHA